MKYGEFELITREQLTDLSVLQNAVLYSDEVEEMPKDEQKRIYTYCRLHACNKACQENLRQIRYAVTKLYFNLNY